eukprot:CAMPEP_0167745142 /NCGR_PEP_ID=MMETSP0110_2-20121227/2985_1 /TAXON_ID=629695 /ORGANISM="Gymnochlora sp., Strain CCMP2014" /LENGTH=406 /DNA_ID=CAMNT_0007629747 /DNA_START=42 /DNA_END=1262 /DNA_ORIENTATION=-
MRGGMAALLAFALPFCIVICIHTFPTDRSIKYVKSYPSTSILQRNGFQPLPCRNLGRLKCKGKGFGGGDSSSTTSKPRNKKTEKSKKSLLRRLIAAEDGFMYTGSIRPGIQSPRRTVNQGIALPEYARTGMPSTKGQNPWDRIEVKSREDIKKMRVSGRIAREILDAAGKLVKPGVTTDQIDELVHKMCMEKNCYPSPLNYNGFPKSVCTSINEVICHGIPDSTVIQEGDIVNIDVTIFHDGFHGDCSEMFIAGETDEESKYLIQLTYDAWQEAINNLKPGLKYNEIGGIVERFVNKYGYQSARDFVAHGIGKTFHTRPFIPHVKNSENLGVMKPGHVFTVEPMIAKNADHVMWDDGWTATTIDGCRSAQFEHTFLCTEDGVEALTGKLETSPRQFWELEDQRIKL